MARKAVAATLASLVLFTSLVVADATILSAQDNLASSAQLSSVESRELVVGRYLAGSASLQALASVQAYLSSSPARCDDLQQYLGSISASSSLSGEDSGIAYSANISVAKAPPSLWPQGDNLTIVAPFAGSVPGSLDLRSSLSLKEVGGGGLVSLERHEAHLLHISISPDSASSLCASALGSLASALSHPSCNATSTGAAFESVVPRLAEDASAVGFTLAAGWGFVGGAAGGCSVAYWVTLVEPGVQGVTGSFDWTVRGSGTTA